MIKARNALNSATSIPFGDDGTGDVEESWTFIGDDSDPDLQKRIQDLDLGRAPRVSMDLSKAGVRATQAVEPVSRRGSKK